MWKPFEPDVFTQLGKAELLEQVAQRRGRRVPSIFASSTDGSRSKTQMSG